PDCARAIASPPGAPPRASVAPLRTGRACPEGARPPATAPKAQDTLGISRAPLRHWRELPRKPLERKSVTDRERMRSKARFSPKRFWRFSSPEQVSKDSRGTAKERLSRAESKRRDAMLSAG